MKYWKITRLEQPGVWLEIDHWLKLARRLDLNEVGNWKPCKQPNATIKKALRVGWKIVEVKTI